MSEDHIIAILLLSLLVMVVSLGLLLAALAARWRRRRSWYSKETWGTAGLEPTAFLPGAFSPQAGLRPTTWLAIRTTDLEVVQEVFALDDPKPCAWTEGLAAEAAGRLYVSPPVAGWVLVTGAELPEPAWDIDACFRFLVGLSRKLGHVQYFHRDRASQHHGWAKLESGRVLRAYSWVGYTAWNQGRPSGAESELQLRTFEYDESSPGGDVELTQEMFANVERLPQLAARWSIDPASVNARFWSAHPGISGEFSVPRLL